MLHDVCEEKQQALNKKEKDCPDGRAICDLSVN
jgi:hypothetical protein